MVVVLVVLLVVTVIILLWIGLLGPSQRMQRVFLLLKGGRVGETMIAGPIGHCLGGSSRCGFVSRTIGHQYRWNAAEHVAR